MPLSLRKAMDALYLACVWVAGTSLVLISAVIPWLVFTRYVLNDTASWPEPMAILLTVVLTFIGAAACYRAGLHMRVSFFVSLLPAPAQRAIEFVAEAIMAAMCVFMIVWGIRLVDRTWANSIDAFPWVSVGATYLPIPIGGFITLLFVIERIAIGRPAQQTPGLH